MRVDALSRRSHPRAKQAITPTSIYTGDRGITAAWSPDGRRIALWDHDAIYVVNADGSGLRRLAQNAFTFDSWSPDGQKLIFFRGARSPQAPPPRQGPGLWVINADGSGERHLTRDGYAATWAR